MYRVILSVSARYSMQMSPQSTEKPVKKVLESTKKTIDEGAEWHSNFSVLMKLHSHMLISERRQKSRAGQTSTALK